MKINTIRPYYYFLDNVKVNWQLPYKELDMYHRNLIKDFYWEFHKLLTYNVKSCFTTNGVFGTIAHNIYSDLPDRPIRKDFKTSRGYAFAEENLKEFQNVHVHKKDPHYNYKVEWGGKFFTAQKTTHIKKDAWHWFKDYLHIQNFISDAFYDNLQVITGKDLRNSKSFKIHCTVSRVDIAKNHKGNMVNVMPLANKNHKDIHFYQERSYKKKPYIYGLSIGKRMAKSGIHFRTYDKRFDLDGIQSSLERFGTIYYVRKEWELKSRTLRRFGITTPEDLMATIQKKETLTEIVFRMRKSADTILMKDNQLYRSIHNELIKEFVNPIEGYSMDEHTFNKMMKRKANIFSTKINSDLVQIHAYNPMKQINGLIKKNGIHLGAKQIKELIEALLVKYQMVDLEFDNYERLIMETMEGINKDPQILKSLKEIEDKKRATLEYSQRLVNTFKKNQAAVK